MRNLLILFTAAIAGCATNTVDPSIPSNVTLSAPNEYNERYIESVKFKLNNGSKTTSPAKCLALTVSNNEYTLSDSSGSFVGAYSGKYYNIEKSRQVGGGQSLLYSDDTSAIAKGSTDGTFTFGLAPIKKIITFKVEVNAAPGTKTITFTDIRSAQKSTGVVSNDGFNKAGAWPGAKPSLVYELLNKVADNIQSCMSGR